MGAWPSVLQPGAGRELQPPDKQSITTRPPCK
jgi:hypothetical protein